LGLKLAKQNCGSISGSNPESIYTELKFIFFFLKINKGKFLNGAGFQMKAPQKKITINVPLFKKLRDIEDKHSTDEV
jgi:hypothetical protein